MFAYDDMDDLETLAKTLGQMLNAKSEMLAMAESCTGGMVAAAITSVAGSSAWFDRGFVTYSNQAKTQMLGVSKQTLEAYGAVSEQTAIEMAKGALQNSLATISGSITGIAGPAGGSEQKPVGTVCFAWAHQDGMVQSATQRFSGGRAKIRHQATAHMLNGLMAILKRANKS